MSDGKEIKMTATGTVEEVLPNSLFRVRLEKETSPSPEVLTEGGGEETVKEVIPVAEAGEQGELKLAYLAGKMRLHRIRVLMGDKVEMVLDPYGGRARIVRRLT